MHRQGRIAIPNRRIWYAGSFWHKIEHVISSFRALRTERKNKIFNGNIKPTQDIQDYINTFKFHNEYTVVRRNCKWVVNAYHLDR